MEEQLKQLITEVRKYPNSSPQRQKALNKLLILTQQLSGIYYSTHPNYLEALNKTFEWVCKSIDSFNEQHKSSITKSYVVWINGYLKWRIRDLYVSDNQYTPSLDRPISNSDDDSQTLGETIADPQFSLSLLDTKIEKLQAAKCKRQGEAIRQYIEQDLEGKLTNCHPKKYPQCHCKLLAMELLLKNPPAKLSQLARQLDIKYPTLRSHWKDKCLPLLQTIARKFESKP